MLSVRFWYSNNNNAKKKHVILYASVRLCCNKNNIKIKGTRRTTAVRFGRTRFQVFVVYVWMIKARLTSHRYKTYFKIRIYFYKGKCSVPAIEKCRKMTPCEISSAVHFRRNDDC